MRPSYLTRVKHLRAGGIRRVPVDNRTRPALARRLGSLTIMKLTSSLTLKISI